MDWTAIVVAGIGVLTGLLSTIINAVSKARDRKEKKRDNVSEEIKEIKKQLVDFHEEIKQDVENTSELKIQVLTLDSRFDSTDNQISDLKSDIKELKNQISKNEQDVVLLLRSEIGRFCISYKQRGWCTMAEREHLEQLYNDYCEYGHNHIRPEVITEVMSLPIGPVNN